MKGAIFFSSKYGSTAQYANWIGEATGLPVFDTKDKKVNPFEYDFLVLGCPIIYYKLYNRKWMKANLASIENKPIIFFTVSGAGPGPKLDDWFANSIPKKLISKIKHVALHGRQIPKELTWFDRIMLIIAGLKNPDPVARKEELKGFDYMDKSSIKPIIDLVKQNINCKYIKV
ncbi:flavodoxin domain-containing protein [Psychroserpens luteus]|uniref:Flavodoxin domain-containing protein n=1 Tax=Psychroserpens luteus TaxID=1434066 RepID=A0ABW5ZVX1_9FLAO|nr:flavodoxin domain-containing protein [Psychroserpens luteus]